MLNDLANFLFVHVERWKTHKEINKTEAYNNAARLLSEQCKMTHPTKVDLKEPSEILGGSLQNPADPDVTY